MKISKVMDVECLVNLFSVVFVDLRDFMKTFADCVNDDGEPIAITEKLTVAEIKERLSKVKCDEFCITDSDDSQLLKLVSYISDMTSHYDANGELVRTDIFSYNGIGYDDLMISALLMYFNRFDDVKALLAKLKEISNKIIDSQKDNTFYEDKELEVIRKYRLPYQTVDVQHVYALHSAIVNVDKNTGERQKFGKRLKQVAINLKWHELLEFKLPPIDQEEFDAYWSKRKNYKAMTLEQLNDIITEDFDRYVLPKYIPQMMHYNKNDVFVTAEMVRQKPGEIKLRYSITNAFGIDVLSSARANIADKLTTKFYSDMSGLNRDKFVNERTERTRLSFNKIILPHIKFKTPELQKMLEEMMKVYVYRTTKDDFQKEVTFRGTTYVLACGGIHTKDRPSVLISNDKYVYVHYDYSSYYPSIMVAYKIAPKHLNEGVFVKMVKYFRDTRVTCKHTSDADGYVISGVPNKIAAEALKIVINSIYGKFGSERFFLYDRLAQLRVTINGQLMTMTLVEELELNGIHVISANTDGIVIKLPRDKEETFKEITTRWNEYNKMSADSERYAKYICRDINNYFAVLENGKKEFKGALDPKQYINDLKKGYDMPIVAKVVYEYFINNIPVMETLRNHKDILDFCKTQAIGRQFEVVYTHKVDGKLEDVYSQRSVRFYVSTKGIILQKEHVDTHKRSVLASGLPVQILNTLDDIPIEERNIDYKYYYNEAYKIIDPIKLGISPNQKADKLKGIVSGKLAIRKKARQYLTLFDDSDFE